MMTPEEQVEYLGLAAAVGRLMSTLKSTEAALDAAATELNAIKSGTQPTNEEG